MYKHDFDIFWKYFEKVFMGTYTPQDWNIQNILASETEDIVLINRTNNPLERFNRFLNDAFSSPHPTMTEFVTTICKISQGYKEDLQNIQRKLKKRPLHKIPPVHSIPADYHNFTKK